MIETIKNYTMNTIKLFSNGTNSTSKDFYVNGVLQNSQHGLSPWFIFLGFFFIAVLGFIIYIYDYKKRKNKQ